MYQQILFILLLDGWQAAAIDSRLPLIPDSTVPVQTRVPQPNIYFNHLYPWTHP